jgi:transcriptional regulator with XRE-family HTH domain
MKTPVSTNAPPEVGAALQRLRLARGLTLEDLSRIAGVSKSMLSQIEREKANPTIAITWRLANALGVQIGELLATAEKAPETIRVLDAHETPTLPGHHAGYVLRILGPMERISGGGSRERQEEGQAGRHGALPGGPAAHHPQRRQDRGEGAAGGDTPLIAYQFDSRSGVEVMRWIDRSAPWNSSSGSRRRPSVAFSRP